MTAAALLLHSIFGCGLRHACGFDHHAVSEHRTCDEMEFCRSHGEQPCHGEQLGPSDVIDCCDHHRADDVESVEVLYPAVANCGCGHPGPDQEGDVPCCWSLQCSFIGVHGVGFKVDAGRRALLVICDECWLDLSLRNSLVCAVDPSIRPGGSCSLCALHCCWQI